MTAMVYGSLNTAPDSKFRRVQLDDRYFPSSRDLRGGLPIRHSEIFIFVYGRVVLRSVFQRKLILVEEGRRYTLVANDEPIMNKQTVLEIFARNSQWMTPDEIKIRLQESHHRSSVYSWLSGLHRQQVW